MPIPFSAEHSFSHDLDTTDGPPLESEQKALSMKMNMHYRQVIGLLIWPMVKCRPDYSFHITKLSQVLSNPAQPHYEALRSITKYLAHTIDHGIYYWRKQPRTDLPCHPLPTLAPDNHTFTTDLSQNAALPSLTGFADADWAACRRTRKAVTGGIIMLAGGSVVYKTRFQNAIAHSTTEAEWVSVVDLGKTSLYCRSILDDLGIPQHDATIIYEDNRGALFMANAQQPSPQTRHIDIREFALVDWVAEDLLILEAITSPDNCSDAMTKALPKQLFYRHNDTIMGRHIPPHLIEYIRKEPEYLSLNEALNSHAMPVLGDLSLASPHPKIKGG